jgi:hypothetical protein
LQDASDQIGFGRQDVPVFPDAHNLSVALHLPEHCVQTHPDAALPSERCAEFHLVQRSVFWRAKKAKDLFAKLFCFWFHNVMTGGATELAVRGINLPRNRDDTSGISRRVGADRINRLV